MQLDQLRPEDFETLLGQRLAVGLVDALVDCELTQVRRLPAHSLRTTPPFALLLRGPRDQPLGQGIYPLQHPAHGQLDLFIVPVGPDGAGLGYEITFN